MFHLHEKNAERKRLNGLVAGSAMRVPAAFGDVGKQVFADGALSKKHKELTALAVASACGGELVAPGRRYVHERDQHRHFDQRADDARQGLPAGDAGRSR